MTQRHRMAAAGEGLERGVSRLLGQGRRRNPVILGHASTSPTHVLGYSEVAELAQPLALADSLDLPGRAGADLIINPHATGPKIHLRVTTPTDQRAGGQQRWAIWVGPNKQLIRILKATPGAYFDTGSKRWIFLKPSSEFGLTIQKLLDLDLRIDLEDPLTNAS